MAATLLLSVDPARNRFRFFRVELRRREGEVAELHRCWGRIGSEGRHAIERFGSTAAAEQAHEALLRHRARRGYVDAASEDLARVRRLMAHHRAAVRVPAQLPGRGGVLR